MSLDIIFTIAKGFGSTLFKIVSKGGRKPLAIIVRSNRESKEMILIQAIVENLHLPVVNFEFGMHKAEV